MHTRLSALAVLTLLIGSCESVGDRSPIAPYFERETFDQIEVGHSTAEDLGDAMNHLHDRIVGRTANLGPGWRQATDPKPEDFTRLKQLEFRHVLSGHGEPCLNEARTRYSDTFQDIFGV